jgi:surface-anchored protein
VRVRALLTAVVAGLTAVAVAAAPAQAATLSSGHLDILDVDRVNNALTLTIRNSAVSPVQDNVSPGSTVLAVPPAALSTVPAGGAYSCLGAAGSAVYLLPQSESAATSAGVIWGGWNTQGVPAAGPAKVNLVLDVAASTVPSGARFALYTTSLGSPTFRFNTNSTGSCLKSTFQVNRNAHGHGFWAFTKAGTYTLKFRATGTGVTASAWQTYTFQVG